MSENVTAKILQRFFRHYVHCTRQKVEDSEDIWPVDPLTGETFDPTHAFRLFEPNPGGCIGAKAQLHIRNLSTLWQLFYMNNDIADPITSIKLNQEELENFCNQALQHDIITQAEYAKTMSRYYPLYLQAKKLKKLKQKQMEIIRAAFNGNCERVVEIFLEQGDNITTDKFVPDKLYSVKELGLKGLLPADVLQVNVIMGIAFACDRDTFINACENGCTPTNTDPISNANAFHFAAMSQNIDIIRLMEPYGGDMFAESKVGSVFSMVGELMFVLEQTAGDGVDQDTLMALAQSSVSPKPDSTDDELEIAMDGSESPVPTFSTSDTVHATVTIPKLNLGD